MKAGAALFERSSRRWAIIWVTALVFAPSVAFGEGGIIDQSIDALYNLRDQHQQNVMKSVKGVAEAMQEGPPPDTSAKPWTLDDLNQIRQKNANLLKLNNDLARSQQQILEADNKLLQKLPPDDPRRAELTNEMKQIAAGLPETRNQQTNYRNKLTEANTAIDSWKRKNDPTYVPPKKTIPPAPAAPPEPAEPPKTDDSGGGGGGGDGDDNSLDSLKKKEAAREAEARKLGKEREAAVNKYLDDPNADNRAEAEAIKRRLDGMVDDLNQLRGQVDGLEGTSRPPIHVRSAKAIAKQHRHRRRGGTTTGISSSSSSTGTGCGGMAGSESHHHNPDGTDASSAYQDVAPSSGGGKGRTGRRAQSTQGSAASSQGYRRMPATNTTNQQQLQLEQQQQQAQGQKRNRQQRRRQTNAR